MAGILAFIILGIYLFRKSTPEQEAAGLEKWVAWLCHFFIQKLMVYVLVTWIIENGPNNLYSCKSFGRLNHVLSWLAVVRSVFILSVKLPLDLFSDWVSHLELFLQVYVGLHHCLVIPSRSSLFRSCRVHWYVGVCKSQCACFKCCSAIGTRGLTGLYSRSFLFLRAFSLSLYLSLVFYIYLKFEQQA